jgi:hypothetical protein
MNTEILKNNLEQISEEVHNAWIQEKLSQGFHSPNDCQSSNHKSFINSCEEGHNRFHDVGFTAKFYKWCDKCHADLYPYEELSENIKEYDRVTVRAVISAIDKLDLKEDNDLPEMFKDEVGGEHDGIVGWNPQGVYCGECNCLTCKGCVNEHLVD